MRAVEEQIAFKRQELLCAERRQLQLAIDQLDQAGNAFQKFTALFEGTDPAQLLDAMQKISGMSEEKIAYGLVGARDQDFVEQRRAELQVLK